jgi:putative addiction module component (TIGR02574 family)
MPHAHIDFSHLSPAERLDLVQALWDSLHDDAQAAPISAELRAELDRRHAELDSGQVQGITLEELRQALRHRQ